MTPWKLPVCVPGLQEAASLCSRPNCSLPVSWLLRLAQTVCCLALIQSSPWLRSTGDPSTADRGLTYNWRQSKQSGCWLSPPPSPAVKSMYRKHLNRRGLECALAVDCCFRSFRFLWVTNPGESGVPDWLAHTTEDHCEIVNHQFMNSKYYEIHWLDPRHQATSKMTTTLLFQSRLSIWSIRCWDVPAVDICVKAHPRVIDSLLQRLLNPILSSWLSYIYNIR